MDKDTSHLKNSKTIEDYQGTAPAPMDLETDSDVVEEEIFGYCLKGWPIACMVRKNECVWYSVENNRNPGALSPTKGCGLKRLVCFFGLA